MSHDAFTCILQQNGQNRSWKIMSHDAFTCILQENGQNRSWKKKHRNTKLVYTSWQYQDSKTERFDICFCKVVQVQYSYGFKLF